MSSSSAGGSAAVTGTSQQSSRWSRWGSAAVTRGVAISDWASGYANSASAKIGGERFWPSSNDMPLEIEKCERILRAFTVEGIPDKAELEREEEFKDSKGNFMKKKRKVLKKIPPKIIEKAAGIVIYTSMRSGIAPFGGSGGSGLVLKHLENGSWSAPSAISPNNLSAGLLLGLDIFDAILVIRNPELMKSFGTHKFTIGAETAVVAGPVGAGISAESGIDKAPIYSYIRSRGLYAGVEIMGQVFVDRFDENERFYHWPGIKARDILDGKVHIPPIVLPLHRALRDAETGVAQGGKLEKTVYDLVKVPQNDAVKALSIKKSKERKQKKDSTLNGERLSDEKVSGDILNRSAVGGESDEIIVSRTSVDDEEEEGKSKPESLNQPQSITTSSSNGILQPPPRHHTANQQESSDDDTDDDFLEDGERLRLPPTPQELDALEAAGIPDEEDLKLARKEREEVYQLPPPPMHSYTKRYLDARPGLARSYPREKPILDGRGGPPIRKWRRSLDAVRDVDYSDENEKEKFKSEDDLGESGDIGEGGTTLLLNHADGDQREEPTSSPLGFDSHSPPAHSLAQELEREDQERAEIEKEGGEIAPTPPTSKTDEELNLESQGLPQITEHQLLPSNSTPPESKEETNLQEGSALEESPKVEPKRRSLFLQRESEREELELLKGTKEEEPLDEKDLESPQEVRNQSWHEDDDDEDDEYSRASQSRWDKLANSGSGNAIAETGTVGGESLAEELVESQKEEEKVEKLDEKEEVESSSQEEDSQVALESKQETGKKPEELSEEVVQNQDQDPIEVPVDPLSESSSNPINDASQKEEVSEPPQISTLTSPLTPPQANESDSENLKTPSKSQFDHSSQPLVAEKADEDQEEEEPDSSQTQKAQEKEETTSQSGSHSHSESLHSLHSITTSAEGDEDAFASAENSRAGSVVGDHDEEKENDDKETSEIKEVEIEPEKVEEEKTEALDSIEEISKPSTLNEETVNKVDTEESTSSPQPPSEAEAILTPSTAAQGTEEPAASMVRSPSISSNSSGRNTTPSGSTRGSVRSVTDASLLPPPQRPPRRARGKK